MYCPACGFNAGEAKYCAQCGATLAALPAPGHVPGVSARRGPSRLVVAVEVLVALGVVFVAMQLVPYGHNHTDPPATAPFIWTSSAAQAIAERSCYDCHSNQTHWWWAVEIAPFSWFAQRDISVGRARVNFSAWNGGLGTTALQRSLSRMPPLQYELLHPGARLSAADQRVLVAGFAQALAAQQQYGSAGGAAPSSSDPAAIMATRCNTCHSSVVAQEYHAAGAAQAKAMIGQMVARGAMVTPAEEQTLLAYFTR